ncbi:MAG: secretin N-terminal domain-containing protein [Phycisphaerae bacterium]
MTKDNTARFWKSIRPICTAVSIMILFSIFSAVLYAVETDRFMSRSVRNITPDEAIGFITKVNLGTASQIPNTKTVLITANSSDLSKARALLEVVDSSERYEVILLPAEQGWESKDEPGSLSIKRLEQIVDGLADYSIVTFSVLPSQNEKLRVLIDILGSSIIIAAPASHLEQVISEIDKIAEQKTITESNEPNQPAITGTLPVSAADAKNANKPQDEEFFNNLLESLAEAERIEAALKAQEAQGGAELPMQQNEQPQTSQVTEEAQQQNATRIINLAPEQTSSIKQMTYEPEPTELANEELELQLPETINVVELIDLVGKYLDLNLLYDPKEVTGQVTLRVQGKITVGELYPLLESVLQFRGFSMTRKDNLVTIVPIAKAMETDPVLFDTQDKKVQFGNVIVTRVFDLRYIDTTSAQNLLTGMKLGAHIQAVPDVGKIIVTDYAYRMGRIEELLSIIDQPGEGKQFRYRQLRYTMAQNLVTQVENLAEQLGTLSISVSAPTEQPSPAPVRGRRPTPRTTTPAETGETTQAQVYLDADSRTNRILMIGMPEQLDMVETLIESLDVAQQDLRTLRLYEIQYAGAEEVVEKLQALGIISGISQRTVSTPVERGRITTPQQPGQSAVQETTTVLTKEGLVEEPQVVVIESTNSLLVNATAEQHAQIAMITAYVDAEPQQSATNYVVYPLENQDPEELAAVLNQLIQETIEESSGAGQDSKIVRSVRSKREEDITIIPDPQTYSLVVYAGKKNQQWISSLIEQLDEYRPQVLLDVTLVEITQNEKFEYDLDIISKTYSGSSLRSNQVGTELENFTTNRYADLRSTTSATDSVIKAFLNADKVQALITAIQTDGYGRIMARPKILVNDNQEGEIKTQNTISVAQVKSIVTIPEQGNPYTTKDVTFTDYDAGVTLNIKPHISKGDMLRLEISLNRTDFTLKDPVEITDENGTQTYPSPPDRLSTDVTTVGTVPNGTTIILGGLETIDQSKGQSKVPILGDIPLVGGLFRGVTDSGDQSRLYVFVKANIIRPSDQIAGLEDIRRVSLKSRQAFEEMENKFQNMQDWPGIDPEPMDPVKILEDD